jgi:hypothetical protein
METKAQALYKQFEAAQRKQALAASLSPPAVSDEEKLEKSMFEKARFSPPPNAIQEH